LGILLTKVSMSWCRYLEVTAPG